MFERIKRDPVTFGDPANQSNEHSSFVISPCAVHTCTAHPIGFKSRSAKLNTPQLGVFNLAERKGFEPLRTLPPYRFSRAASSTTPASLHNSR